MKHSGKTCKEEGCTFPLFARGWCKGHYNTLYLLPKQKDKPKKSYTIPRRTEDRSKEDQVYLKKRLKFIVAQMLLDPYGFIYCIFCGKRIHGDPDLHHMDGREGDKLLDEKDWSLAHHDCHMDYDSQPWRKLIWWNGYIERIELSHPHIYKKELKRMDK